MTRTPLLLTFAAAAALAGCGNDNSHTIVAGPEGIENSSNASETNLADVQLPPSITASKIYRCRDNSVVYVDWLSDGTARVRTDKAQAGETVQVGEGGAITGSADSASITYNGKSCKA